MLLPALALTRRDRKNDGVSAQEEAYIFGATKDILTCCTDPATVAEAAKPDAPSPPQMKADGENTLEGVLILGCPAHDEAEEITLAMLTELPRADGCRVEAVGTKELPADVEKRVKDDHPALVFISILPPGGFVQARYLCHEQAPRNLRARPC